MLDKAHPMLALGGLAITHGGLEVLPEAADHADRVVRILQLAPRARHKQRLGVGSNSTATNRLNEAIDQKVLKQDYDRPNRAGRATPRAFWLLKTSRELEDSEGPSVFPSPEAVRKNIEKGGVHGCDVHSVHAVHADQSQTSPPADEKTFEKGGVCDCDVDGVHGVQASPDDGTEEAAYTAYTASTSQPQTPPSLKVFSLSTPEPRDIDDDIVDEGEL
jgi:hypothetical protein